jgi:hypothetical protein
VQIHDGRCAAVDMVLVEAVSEKTLHSIRDLSMVVLSRRELSRSCRIRSCRRDFHAFTDPAKQSGEGKGPTLSHDDPATYSLTTELPHLQYLIAIPTDNSMSNMFHQGDLQSGISAAIQEQKLVACFIRQGTIGFLEVHIYVKPI